MSDPTRITEESVVSLDLIGTLVALVDLLLELATTVQRLVPPEEQARIGALLNALQQQIDRGEN